MNRFRKLPVILAGLALIGGGVVLIYTGRVSRVPRYWERAEGFVISSQVRDSNARRIGEVEFQYEIDGRKVLGRQLQFVDPDRTVGDLPRGKKVVVRYDPAQPEHSRLEEGERLTWRWAIAAALLGSGIGLLLWGVRRPPIQAPHR
jgi:hypothetical protein